MEHNYKSRIINGFVINLKSTVFDVMTSMRRNMDIIEAQIGTVKDEKKNLELQQLWAEYHEADKQCLVSAKRMEEAMERLDNCFQAYYTSLYQPSSVKKVVNNVGEAPTEESVTEAPKEETSEAPAEASVTEAPKEETSEATTEESVTEAPKEVVSEATTEAPVTEAPKEETSKATTVEPVVEAPKEVVSEAKTEKKGMSPQDAINELISKAQVSSESEAKEAENETETSKKVLIEPIPEPPTVDESKEAESANESSTESNEDKANIQAPNPLEGLLPLIPEETPSSTEKEKQEETTSETASSNSLISLPTVEDGLISARTTVAEKEDNTQSLIFNKTGIEETKAIIVNQKQKTKLSNSLEMQQTLLEGDIPNIDNKKSVQEQIEQLMNQLPTLYEQGEIAKAEEISEQIRILNEKITPAA